MTQSIASLSHLAEGDKLSKEEKLALYKLAASCGAGSKSIHGKVYDWWAEFDRELFNGELSPCLIIIGITEHSGCLGSCQPVAGQARITLHQALIYPAHESLSDQFKRPQERTRWGMPKKWMGEQLLKDVLLHEMQHQAQADLDLMEPGEDAHNGPSWAHLCARSAEYLGITDVWFPHYKRGKETITNPDGTKTRKNVWKPAKGQQQPEGTRIATHDEVLCFPSLVFQNNGTAEERYAGS